MLDFPNILRPKMNRKNDDNVTPLRDSEPTMPHRYAPPPPPQQSVLGGSYAPPHRVPKAVAKEMDIARTMADELLPMDDEARTRIVKHVEFILDTYGKPREHVEDVEGAPV